MRAARADVDLDAIADNVRALAAAVAPAGVCAVVKADGYGHGAIAVAQEALRSGATWLAVALVEEGAVLRKAGITAPILLLSEPRPDDVGAAIHWDLRLTVYTREGIEAAADAAAQEERTARLHLKVNTGMNRVGARPADVVALAQAVVAQPGVELEGVWTHLATADEPGNPFADEQLDRFDAVVAALVEAGIDVPLRHAANSAGALDHLRSRFDLVRCGIAVYGIPPSPELAGSAAALGLRPALSLRAEVAYVKTVDAGEGISYGQRHTFAEPRVVATVPIGYADGVPRQLAAAGGEVLVGGERRPIVGVVTMDQLMVDCGAPGAAAVEPGDEVVLLGRQGADEITAGEWAERLGTIAYEIVCGIGPRVPRHYG